MAGRAARETALGRARQKNSLHVVEWSSWSAYADSSAQNEVKLFKSEGLCPSLLSYNQLQSLSFFGVRLIRTPMSGAALLPS